MLREYKILINRFHGTLNKIDFRLYLGLKVSYETSKYLNIYEQACNYFLFILIF